MSDDAASSTVAIVTDNTDDNRGSRKRQKVTRACDSCRSRKKKCSGDQPCSNCWAQKLSCTFEGAYNRGRAATPPTSIRTQDETHVSFQSPLLESANAGTLPDPVLSNSALPSRRQSPEAVDFAGQYLGPGSAHSFLKRAWKRLFDHDTDAGPAFVENLDQNENDPSRVSSAINNAYNGSVFMFGDRKAPDVDASISFMLPSRERTTTLLATYLDFAAPSFKHIHSPSVTVWLEQFHNGEYVSPARKAILLTILATAALFVAGPQNHFKDSGEQGLVEAEVFFKAAEQDLAQESGPPSLEGIQARLLMVLYLLSTSRMNQAWFTIGTAVQLIMVLGLHRRKNGWFARMNFIQRECSKRAFWTCYDLDMYLSMMLGRPRLLQDDDVDQDLPQCVNDEELTLDGIIPPKRRRDCNMIAPVQHTKLARIVSRAIKEQHQFNARSMSDADQIAWAKRKNEEVRLWHESLPPFLSGAIHASSLVISLQRQSTVLRLAKAHAHMIINRPLLIRRLSQRQPLQEAEQCLHAAMDVLDHVMDAEVDDKVYPTFWLTQYITFNALSILYIYAIQSSRKRIQLLPGSELDPLHIISLADSAQARLAVATKANAPSQRYSIILRELQLRAQEVTTSSTHTPVDTLTSPSAYQGISPSGASSLEFPLEFDFWPQLDSLPLSFFSFPEQDITLNPTTPNLVPS